MKPYPLVDEIIRPVLRVGMPRAPRLNAPGGTVHVVARWRAQRAVGSPAFLERHLPRREEGRVKT